MRKSTLEFGNELHMVVSTHEGVPRVGQIFGLYHLFWREKTAELPSSNVGHFRGQIRASVQICMETFRVGN